MINMGAVEMIRDVEVEVRDEREREMVERLLGVHLRPGQIVRIPAREHLRLRDRLRALRAAESRATL